MIQSLSPLRVRRIISYFIRRINSESHHGLKSRLFPAVRISERRVISWPASSQGVQSGLDAFCKTILVALPGIAFSQGDIRQRRIGGRDGRDRAGKNCERRVWQLCLAGEPEPLLPVRTKRVVTGTGTAGRLANGGEAGAASCTRSPRGKRNRTVRSLPKTLIYDRQGILRQKIVGFELHGWHREGLDAAAVRGAFLLQCRQLLHVHLSSKGRNYGVAILGIFPAGASFVSHDLNVSARLGQQIQGMVLIIRQWR